MDWNKPMHSDESQRSPLASRRAAITAMAALTITLMSGCTVMSDRESPLNEVTKGSPTVLDVYRGNDYRKEAERSESESLRRSRMTAQDRMREHTNARPVQAGDELTQRYWAAVEPMNQRFARVPNPDLVMVVYPHLAKGQYPVPGYVTVFPMYEQTQYALPGEVTSDLLAWRNVYWEAQTRPPVVPDKDKDSQRDKHGRKSPSSIDLVTGAPDAR